MRRTAMVRFLLVNLNHYWRAQDLVRRSTYDMHSEVCIVSKLLNVSFFFLS